MHALAQTTLEGTIHFAVTAAFDYLEALSRNQGVILSHVIFDHVREDFRIDPV